MILSLSRSFVWVPLLRPVKPTQNHLNRYRMAKTDAEMAAGIPTDKPTISHTSAILKGPLHYLTQLSDIRQMSI